MRAINFHGPVAMIDFVFFATVIGFPPLVGLSDWEASWSAKLWGGAALAFCKLVICFSGEDPAEDGGPVRGRVLWLLLGCVAAAIPGWLVFAAFGVGCHFLGVSPLIALPVQLFLAAAATVASVSMLALLNRTPPAKPQPWP